ncbi:MAG: bifunctional nuclease family protein [Bacteroidales bacterium]|nr:bifunctional nuclease family protein [Bacteroidales bacterium]
MNKIVLEEIGLTYTSSQSGAYALLLSEKGSKLKMPIIIGSAEAQSIALAAENHKGKRPLTHDLFKAFADVYLINIREVCIDRYLDGVFYAELVCEKDGLTTVIDARASDAIALALRFRCPIYANEDVMTETGIVIEDSEIEEAKDGDENKSNKGEVTLKQLQEQLDEAVENEDFEKAVILRDAIFEIKRVETDENPSKQS